MKHIVLIGFMGAGKSTVGRALAAELGRELLDTDQMIEEKAGCRITEIFARQGEQAFRRLEEEILKQLAEEKAPAVISTGGGMPVFEKNRPALRRLGTVVYLQVKPETCLLYTSRCVLETGLIPYLSIFLPRWHRAGRWWSASILAEKKKKTPGYPPASS